MNRDASPLFEIFVPLELYLVGGCDQDPRASMSRQCYAVLSANSDPRSPNFLLSSRHSLLQGDASQNN
jgi:hypothetical protein